MQRTHRITGLSVGQQFLEIQVYINWKFALKGISSVLKYCKI